MADLGDEDRNVDYEAIQDKQKFQKEIEAMGMQHKHFDKYVTVKNKNKIMPPYAELME